MGIRFFMYMLPIMLFASSGAMGMNQKCGDIDVISVRGVGRRSVKTSIAVITLGIESNGKTARIVQRDLAKRASRLVRYLRRQRVSKLQTRGVSLFANFNNRVTPHVVVGYRGSNTVSFQVPISRAGIILDGAVRNGATRINGVAFKASNRTNQRARNRALKDAVRMARKEAKIVAMVAGNALGRALVVRVTDSFFPQPVRSSMALTSLRSRRRRSTTPIIARDQIVSARVEVKYDSIY